MTQHINQLRTAERPRMTRHSNQWSDCWTQLITDMHNNKKHDALSQYITVSNTKMV